MTLIPLETSHFLHLVNREYSAVQTFDITSAARMQVNVLNEQMCTKHQSKRVHVSPTKPSNHFKESVSICTH